MKSTLPLFIAIVATLLTLNVHAQVNDSTAVHLFINRQLNPDDVQFNSMLLIPQLYRQNKMDTLDAVIHYWEHTERIPEPLFSYFMIDEIKKGTFREKLYMHDVASNTNIHAYGTDYYKLHIVTYLRKYYAGCNIKDYPRKYLHSGAPKYVIDVYDRYYQFLQSLAQPVCDKKELTPAAGFLIHFYAHPDTGMFYNLRSPEYKGSLLRDAALGKKEYSKNNMEDVQLISGVHLELNTGAQMYECHLSALQSTAQPEIGFLMGGRSNKLTYDFSCNLSWASTPRSFVIHADDSLINAQYKGGGYMGIDCGYQLYRKNKCEIDGLLGAGCTVFDAAYDDVKTNSYLSPDINIGLGYRFYFRHRQSDSREAFDYLGVQAKYHLLCYTNTGGTAIDGNAISLTLAVGGYSKDNITSRDIFSDFGNSFMKTLLKRY